jgi:hypothetical protein
MQPPLLLGTLHARRTHCPCNVDLCSLGGNTGREEAAGSELVLVPKEAQVLSAFIQAEAEEHAGHLSPDMQDKGQTGGIRAWIPPSLPPCLVSKPRYCLPSRGQSLDPSSSSFLVSQPRSLSTPLCLEPEPRSLITILPGVRA